VTEPTDDGLTARAAVYESDPLLTFVERARGWQDYYEIPSDMLDACEAAEKARAVAIDAVVKYIRDHGVPKMSA